MEPFTDSDFDSSEEEEDAGGDVEENLVRRSDVAEKKKSLYRMHMLYACTFSGKEKLIRNNLPGAVAVLSNSKRLFLGHINTMLTCGDPRLCELCYIDTDSCIFSMTYPDWERCLLPDKLELWREKRVMADEEGDRSCHGQMKCEGLYESGLFKTLKIYRLYNRLERYTRCKGVNRQLAEKLGDADFDSQRTDRTVVTRTCLRPTASGQIAVTRESRQLAVAFNFKRKVDDTGVHTFPVSFVAECSTPGPSSTTATS